mmetsp:Transcript_87519/g.248162  ORF Transcript_87519/g.248162 Transcript_87519/m.248162 type:complete len:210 (-) Transcript_87519:56-685(-)
MWSSFRSNSWSLASRCCSRDLKALVSERLAIASCHASIFSASALFRRFHTARTFSSVGESSSARTEVRRPRHGMRSWTARQGAAGGAGPRPVLVLELPAPKSSEDGAHRERSSSTYAPMGMSSSSSAGTKNSTRRSTDSCWAAAAASRAGGSTSSTSASDPGSIHPAGMRPRKKNHGSRRSASSSASDSESKMQARLGEGAPSPSASAG